MILLAGDSWASGEWGFVSSGALTIYKVTHPGMGYYLSKKGYDVKTLAKGSASNKETNIRLSTYFNSTVESIIWFQTESITDLRPYDPNLFRSLNLDSFLKLNNDLLDETYQTLNNFNVKVYCLGAGSKLNLNLIRKYDNLIPVVESIPEFFYPKLKYPEVRVRFEWAKYIRNKELMKVLKESERVARSSTTEEFKEFFWPDGVHPNRKAHKVLTKYFITNFLEVN